MAEFTLNSETHFTRSEIRKLFNYISDFKNFAYILPEDKVENFKYDGDACSFSIRGSAPMSIRITHKEPFQYILFHSEGLAKFNFSLKASFIGEPDQAGECKVELSGDLNPFIKSMVEKSLSGLVNTMALKLSRLEL